MTRSSLTIPFFTVLVPCLAASACGDPSGPRPPEGVASLQMVSGDRMGGAPGSLLAEEARVRVASAEGAPAAGVQVCFEAKNGATIVGGAEAVTQSCRATGADGVAAVQWRLGPAAGEQRLVASVTGLPRVTFTARAGTSTPVQLYLTSHSLYLNALRDTGYVGVRATDAQGYTIRVPFTVTPNPYAQMAVTGDSVRVIAIDPGAHRVYVTADGYPALRDSLYVEISPRTVSISLGAHRQVVGVGDTLWIPVTGLRDARGHEIRGRPVAWTTTVPGATVRAETVNGYAFGVFQAGMTFGSGTVTATADGVSVTAPVSVPDRLRAPRVMAAEAQSCALDAEGRMYCWGSLGALAGSVPGVTCGLGSTCRPRAVPVLPAWRFSRVDSYQNATLCMLDLEGRAYCVEYAPGTAVPVPVATDLRFREISVGEYQVCALTAEGAAHCWRQKSWLYPEGAPVAPAPVGDARFTTLSTGASHACGLTTEGTGRCWVPGMGPGPYTAPDSVLTPGGNARGMQLRSIAAGNHFTCAVDAAGQAYCWGNVSSQNYGQLGRGGQTTGGPVSSATRFTAVDAGGWSACALAEDGTAWCWGAKSQPHRNGIMERDDVPTQVPGGVRFTRLAAGAGQHCGVDVEGAVQCWYSNLWGNLGNGLVGSFSPEPEYVLLQ